MSHLQIERHVGRPHLDRTGTLDDVRCAEPMAGGDDSGRGAPHCFGPALGLLLAESSVRRQAAIQGAEPLPLPPLSGERGVSSARLGEPGLGGFHPVCDTALVPPRCGRRGPAGEGSRGACRQGEAQAAPPDLNRPEHAAPSLSRSRLPAGVDGRPRGAPAGGPSRRRRSAEDSPRAHWRIGRPRRRQPGGDR